MEKITDYQGIPISPLLAEMENSSHSVEDDKRIKNRLIHISTLSVAVAMLISLIAKFLVMLINIVTNISFYGKFLTAFRSPADNHLGLWVIAVPAIGGILVGFMALYGSKAIRGHGIPEAMEQILTNQSKIKPSITFLKPLSSAIAIGTGGPFGAEGPIIATGGALGSTLGQIFKITSNERKIILAAGATAGMSAIFGTPIAAVFLAIELLLFEFSPRSILPVALACITGAAGHHLLFGAGPVFPMGMTVAIPSNGALAIYSAMGLVIGFLSMGVTKIVYYIEDGFDHLPIHWMWWPAIGGLAVGIVGYFAPHTLGVGYENITGILSGAIGIVIILRLFFFKFLSWAIALGSGTSGGTLAPLLTIGGAGGALLGWVILYCFPNCGINLPLAALIGMSAMFAGASRAYLTSITFALEATGQSHALLPLLGGCTAAYIVSFFLMENTIMTEKIARRGVFTPDSYEPDVLETMAVSQVASSNAPMLSPDSLISEVRKMISSSATAERFFIVADVKGNYLGITNICDINNYAHEPQATLKQCTKPNTLFVKSTDSLRKAVEIMSERNVQVLPVVNNQKIMGVLSQQHVVNAYKYYHEENELVHTPISLKRQRLKVMSRGKNIFKSAKK